MCVCVCVYVRYSACGSVYVCVYVNFDDFMYTLAQMQSLS